LKQSELVNETAAGGELTRTLKCKTVCNDDSKGWFIDLPDAGERVNVDLRMAGSTLVVSSNVPSSEPCVSGGYGWVNYLNFQTGRAVNEGPNKEGPAGVLVSQGLIMGNDLSSTKDGKVTGHVSPSTFPEKPVDVRIPVAPPKPKGKRISWRELM
jgi:Tfp pilus tip-associated adhesin PilY1